MEMITLDLAGSDYEMGYQHGRRCAEQARECVARWGRIDHPDRDRIDRVLAEVMDDLSERMPWFCQRMQGISEGSGIPLQDIQTTNLCEIIWNEVTGWCSVLATRGVDGRIYLAKSSDTGTGSSAFHLLERMRPDDGFGLLRCSFAGYVGTCAGVNEAGLAFGGASIKAAPADFRTGLPLDPLPEEALRRCRTCEEAVVFCETVEARSQGGNLVFADASGRACNVLKYPGLQRVRWLSGPCLAATNHAVEGERVLGLLPGDEQFGENSRHRLEHLLAQGAKVPADLPSIQAFLHTRVADGGVFRESDPILGTCAAYVIDPHERAIYVAHGESTDVEFVPYTLAQ